MNLIKKIVYLTTLTFSITYAHAKPIENVSIREKFYNDATSYRHFLELGQAACLDDLMVKSKIYRKTRKTLYQAHISTLGGLNAPLVKYFLNDKHLNQFLLAYQKRKMPELIDYYRHQAVYHDEYFFEKSSPLFICHKLFAQNHDTKQLYRQFLFDKHTKTHDVMNDVVEHIGKMTD